MSAQYEKSLATKMLDQNPELRQVMSDSDFLSKFTSEHRLKKLSIDEVEYYVVEGDMLLDEDELFLYARHQKEVDKAREAEKNMQLAGFGIVGLTDLRGLVGIKQSGKLLRWRDGLTLTYCVLKQTFSELKHYEEVSANMKQATEDWEKTCGVKFEHKAELDESSTIAPNELGVLFTVREINASGSFIASAFFPSDPPSRRRVLIDPSYYEMRFDKVGVLRHELGHVLGFRHEHIRSGAPAVCPNEPDDDTIDLTQYDPQSVMHYFCGGVGTAELTISALDKIGSQQLYGQPFDVFQFVG